jgi:hypothetical protein
MTNAHQLVHGYDNGHRLLAGSRSPGPVALRLIDRLSDATSPARSAGPTDSGRLTGYPLPGGEYALAMTWPDLAASRPNTVWTHTLVLPRAALSVSDLRPLAALLRHPAGRHDLDAYTSPIELPPPSQYATTPTAGPAARDVLNALYGPEPTGLAACRAGDDPAELCLGVWTQQWPRLRRRFAFSTGAPERRSLDTRPFDLAVTPPGSRPPIAKPLPDDVLDALAADLDQPGPLRVFLRSCGADSSRPEVVAALTRVWLSARRAHDPRSVLHDTVRQAPSPDGLRRLKRALLRAPKPLLAYSDPILTIAALADPQIGASIQADDADAEAWLNRAWAVNPRSAFSAANSYDPPTGSGRPDNSPPLDTVDRAIRRVAESVAATRTRPIDLAWLAEGRLDVAARTLDERADPAWWDAWAALPTAPRDGLASAAAGHSAEAIAALLRCHAPAATWVALHDAAPEKAANGLLDALASAPDAIPDEWAVAADQRAETVAAALRAHPDPRRLAAAADLAAHAPRIARLPYDLWQPLAGHHDLWQDNPVRAAVLLCVALDGTGPVADIIAAHSFQHLHRALARSHPDPQTQTETAWQHVEHRLPGHPDDWDRCRRLAEGTAAAALGRPGIPANTPDGPARDQLEEAVTRLAATQRKHKNPLEELFGFLRRP